MHTLEVLKNYSMWVVTWLKPNLRSLKLIEHLKMDIFPSLVKSIKDFFSLKKNNGFLKKIQLLYGILCNFSSNINKCIYLFNYATHHVSYPSLITILFVVVDIQNRLVGKENWIGKWKSLFSFLTRVVLRPFFVAILTWQIMSICLSFLYRLILFFHHSQFSYSFFHFYFRVKGNCKVLRGKVCGPCSQPNGK